MVHSCDHSTIEKAEPIDHRDDHATRLATLDLDLWENLHQLLQVGGLSSFSRHGLGSSYQITSGHNYVFCASANMRMTSGFTAALVLSQPGLLLSLWTLNVGAFAQSSSPHCPQIRVHQPWTGTQLNRSSGCVVNSTRRTRLVQ